MVVAIGDFKMYLVVWSGGYEAPNYVLFRSLIEAKLQADRWRLDMDENEGDYIDVLELNITKNTIERVEEPTT